MAVRHATEEIEVVAEPKVVGYVGLGQAGWPMSAALIKAGYELIAYDIDTELARRFAEEHGCVGAAKLDELAEADLVITMLPNGNVVRDVLLGSGGLARKLRPGTIVIDTSSSDPYKTRELGAELAELGITLLDSPVTRPEPGNRRNTLMLGGDDEDAVERVVPVLSAIAGHVVRVGRLGNGHAMKTLNNFVAASGLVAGLDAMAIGHRFGLDPATMMDVFTAGTGQNFSTAFVLKDEALSRRYQTGFQLALLVKDLGIASELTASVGFDTPLPGLVRDQLASAMEYIDDPHADHAEAVRYWEQRVGEQFRPPGPSQMGQS